MSSYSVMMVSDSQEQSRLSIEIDIGTEFAFYVNKTGWRSRKDFIIYWEGCPTGFGLSRILSHRINLTCQYSSAFPLCSCIRTDVCRDSKCSNIEHRASHPGQQSTLLVCRYSSIDHEFLIRPIFTRAPSIRDSANERLQRQAFHAKWV